MPIFSKKRVAKLCGRETRMPGGRLGSKPLLATALTEGEASGSRRYGRRERGLEGWRCLRRLAITYPLPIWWP